MTTTLGWTDGDVWAFQQLLKKANDVQLQQATREVKLEQNRRWYALQGRMSDCCGACVGDDGRCGQCAEHCAPHERLHDENCTDCDALEGKR